jgi:hypothetical protein
VENATPICCHVPTGFWTNAESWLKMLLSKFRAADSRDCACAPGFRMMGAGAVRGAEASAAPEVA